MGRPDPAARFAKIFEIPAPTFWLDDVEPRLAGGLIIATMAYPESQYSQWRLFEAIRISARTMGGYDDASFADRFATPRIALDQKTLHGGIKRLESRLRKRFDAAHMAMQTLVATDSGRKPSRVWGTRWNQEAAIRKAMEDGGIDDARNFRRRYLDTSAAVIHLTAAYLWMVSNARIGVEPEAWSTKIVTEPGFRAELIAKAMLMEDLVERSDLRIPPDVLIRFRAGRPPSSAQTDP